jgi:hypothetical protein
MSHKNNTIEIVKGIIAVLLLLCLIDADYGFYQAMRTLVSFGFAFLAYNYYKSGDETNAIVFLCLLIVFQPLLRIGLGRGIWIVVDVLVAGFLIYQIIKSRGEVTSSSAKQAEDREKSHVTKSRSSLEQQARKIRDKW